MTNLRDAVLGVHDAGLCLIPVKTDGSKAPAVLWTTYEKERPTLDTVQAWFAGDRYDGFGVICGAVSGGLEMLELEGRAIAEGFLREYIDLLEDHGLGELWARITRGYSETTPSGGLHILIRVEGEPRRNTKLASRPAREDEITDQEREVLATKPGKVFSRVLIETRGEGGFVIIAPSGGRTHETGKAWTLVAGGLDTISTVTEDERDALHAVATLLDSMPAVEAPAPRTAPKAERLSADDDGLRPGDDFNIKADWVDIIGPHGWRHTRNFGNARGWSRPGKSGGLSATTGRNDGDNLYVFSSSTEFETEKPYSKFAAYALLEHGGNYANAARALRLQGYGGERPRDDFSGLIGDPPKRGDDEDDEEDRDDDFSFLLGVYGNLATVHPIRPDADPRPHALGVALKYTDDWLALVLVAQFGDRIRYCPKWGYWLTWDGARWQECADDGPIREHVRTIARSMSEDTKDSLKAKTRAGSRAGIEAAIALARGDARVVVRPNQLDSHLWELNTPGGIVDLRTGQLLPHDPSRLHTKLTAATPDFNADATIWTRFLNTTFNRDADLIGYMQRVSGYSAIGVVREHILPFAYGEGGNGKGAFLEAISKVLGDYAGKAKRGFLAVRDRDAHPEEIAVLAGLRMVLCSETNEGDRFDEGKVKELTGGDTLTGRHMYGKSFSFEPSHTLWLMGNHRPKVESGGRSFWRRVREIPFVHKVPDGEIIQDLQGVLAREHGGALMAWIVRGAMAYNEGGLAEPESVIKATSDYQREQDTLKRFVETRCHIGGGKYVRMRADEFRSAYEAWCRVDGGTPLDARTLGRRLKSDYDITRQESNGKSFYTNVTLLAAEDEGDEDKGGW